MAVTPSYAILDPDGRLVGGKDVDAQQDPASTTKVWTLVTLSTLVKEGKLSSDFIEKHQKDITLMMRDSNNAASNRLATAAGLELAGDGDRTNNPTFAKEMNRIAQEHGLSNTRFVTPDGMPADGHVSTARDMARMMHVYRTEHAELLRFSEEITTAGGIIDCEGIDNFKTGTAVGLYGSSGKSSGVGNKDGYSFSVAGADGSVARKAMVLSIAQNIPTHANWRAEQEREGGFMGTFEDAALSRPKGNRPEPDLHASIENDFQSFFAQLLALLIECFKGSLQEASVEGGEFQSAGATPKVDAPPVRSL